MKTEKRNNYLVALIWLGCGYLSWVSAIYAFSYGTVNLQKSITQYIKAYNSYLFATLSNFIIFHITDFIFAFTAAAVLSRLTGKRILWLFCFVAGAIARPLYETIRSHMFNLNSYEHLPSWATTAFSESIIAYLIVVPVLTWAGAFIGDKYYKEKRA